MVQSVIINYPTIKKTMFRKMDKFCHGRGKDFSFVSWGGGNLYG